MITRLTKDSTCAQALETQERHHRKELANIQEKLDAMNAAHEKELNEANNQTASFQDQVKMLLSEKISLEDFMAKEHSLQEQVKILTSEKRSLEEVLAAKEVLICQTMTRSEDLEKECSLLKDQHQRLSDDLVNEKNEAIDERDNMGMDLQQAQKKNEILEIALVKAEKHGAIYLNRMHNLNHALGQAPDEAAAVNAMIETKDKMFSNLEAKAGECYTALVGLEKSSRGASERAEVEISQLKKQLSQSAALITKLTDSKAVFQQQSADIFAMLRARILSSDLFLSMDHHFSLVLQDNSVLHSTILEQTQELSNKNVETASLRAKVLEISKLLGEKEERCCSLETEVRDKEDQVGVLEVEMNALTSENEEVNARNDRIIADIEGRLRVAYACLDETRDERERELIRNKESEILHLRENCNKHSQAHRELQGQVRSQEELIKDYTSELCMTQFRVDELSAELQAAEEKFTTLEQETRAQLGLPTTVSILEVLSQKTELDAARRNCLDLEEELQTAQIEAEKRRAAFNSVKDKSERWMFGMQDVGLELLARLRQAQGVSVESWLDDSDEELEDKLRRFWEVFE